MVKRVSLFQTADGAHFSTEAEAKAHEATVAAQATVASLLKKLKLDGSVINIGETEGIFLETFLIDNREALLLALNGNVAKVKQTRKKKTAIPETPVEEVKLEQPAAAPAAAAPEAAGNSDAQLDSLVAELGA